MKTTRSPSTGNGSYGKKNFRSNKSNSSSSSSSSSSSRNSSNTKTAGIAFNFNDDKLVQSMNDRLNFLLIKALGSKAIVTIISGDRYKGTVVAIDNSNLSVVLSNVTSHPNIFNDISSSAEKEEMLPDELIIESKNIMDLQLLDIDLSDKIVPVITTEGANASSKAADSAFKTDTAISGHQKIRERELHMWAPSEEDSKLLDSTALLLEDIDNNNSTNFSSKKSMGSESWDQFEVNEKAFGIKSSYDENLYTTRINKDAPDYQERLKEADRIAKEIEGSGHNGNIHMAEERGLIVDDRGLDEEDKYSGVDRRGDDLMAFLKSGNGTKAATANSTSAASSKTNSSIPLPSVNNGKYVPPKQRNEVQYMDPAILSSTRGAKATSNSGAKKNNKVIIKDVNAQQAIASLKEFSQNFKIPEFKNTSKNSISFSEKSAPASKPSEKESTSTINNKMSDNSPTPKESTPLATASSTSKTTLSSTKEEDAKKSKLASPSKKKMDPRTPAFKLNPAARAFTPSGSLPPPPHNHHLPHHPLPPLVPQMVLPTGAAPLPVPPVIPGGGAASPLKSFTSMHGGNSSATGGSVSPATSASPGLRHQTMSRHGHGKRRVSIPPFLKSKDNSTKSRGDLNGTDFNFIYTASKQDGPIEKAYFTQPLWSSSSETSYKDNFPEDVPMTSSMSNMQINGMPPLMNGLGGGSAMMMGGAAAGMPPPMHSFIPSNPAAALASMNPNMLAPMNMMSPRSAVPMMQQQQVGAAGGFDAAGGQMFVPSAMNPAAAAALASSSGMNVDPNLYMQFATQFMMNAASMNGGVGGMTSPMMGGFPMMGMQSSSSSQGHHSNNNSSNSSHHNSHHNNNSHHSPYSGNRGMPMGSPQMDMGYNNGHRGSYGENRYYGGNTNRGRQYHNNHNNHHHSNNSNNNSGNNNNNN